MMYAADIADGRILAINLTTSSVSVLYRAHDDLQPYTIALSQEYIYFSAWNRKLVCVLLRLDCVGLLLCCISLNAAKHFMRRLFLIVQ